MHLNTWSQGFSWTGSCPKVLFFPYCVHQRRPFLSGAISGLEHGLFLSLGLHCSLKLLVALFTFKPNIVISFSLVRCPLWSYIQIIGNNHTIDSVSAMLL